MVKWFLLFAALTICFVLVYFLFTSRDRKRVAPQSAVSATTILITYKDRVFNPATISLKKGQMVEFKNLGNESLQIALGKHPNHSEVEGFNETVLSSGKSYYFTIWQPGIYEYHNHLKSLAKGTLIIQ